MDTISLVLTLQDLAGVVEEVCHEHPVDGEGADDGDEGARLQHDVHPVLGVHQRPRQLRELGDGVVRGTLLV